MTEFVLGILASICAAIILLVATKIFSPFQGSWGAFLRFIASTPRLRRAGLNYLIPSRAHYRFLHKGETIGKYLGGVQHTLIYVGFWHAKGVEMDNIRDAFRGLLEKGCTIELVLLSNEIEDAKIEIISKYLGIATSGFRSRVSEAWNYITELKKQLPKKDVGRFIVKAHKEAIYASCFIIDHDTASAKALIDIKIFGLSRENSFSMELVKTEEENNLYNRFVTSFFKIIDAAEIV